MLDMCRAVGFDIRGDPDDSEMRIVTLPIAELRDERRRMRERPARANCVGSPILTRR